jgi:two-component system response regulator RpaA
VPYPVRKNDLGRTIFTTGMVARICKVAPRTVSKWFDSGQLKGYRLPGSNDRRVPRDDLVDFLLDNGIPCPAVLDQRYSTLAIGLADGMSPAPWLDSERHRLEIAPTALDAGTALAGASPIDCVVIDFTLGRTEALSLAHAIRAHEERKGLTMLALTHEDEADVPGVLAAGYTTAILRPFAPEALAHALDEAVRTREQRNGLPAPNGARNCAIRRNGHAV